MTCARWPPGSSPAECQVARDITLLDSDPYEHGWLYQVRGQPQPSTVDAHAYTVVLSAAIDGMLMGRDVEAGDE